MEYLRISSNTSRLRKDCVAREALSARDGVLLMLIEINGHGEDEVDLNTFHLCKTKEQLFLLE